MSVARHPTRESLVQALWAEVERHQASMRAALFLPEEIEAARRRVQAAFGRLVLLDPGDERCPRCTALPDGRCEATEGSLCVRRAS